MVRWQPDAQGRLAQAAMELYGERGYDRTTVAEIAERAGLTERTFFRYFADKREVLFAGAGALQDFFLAQIHDAPPDLAPLEVIARMLDAVGAWFEDIKEYSHVRAAIIASNAELRERELIKLAGLAVAVAQAMRERGVPDPGAGVVAEMGIAVFRVSFERWSSGSEPATMAALMRESMDELVAISVRRLPTSG